MIPSSRPDAFKTMAASSLQQTALTLFQKGNYAEAIKFFEQARAAYQSENNPALASEMQNNLGVIYRAQKNYALALPTIETALAEFRALNDSNRTAQALGNLGAVLLEMNQLERAAQALNEALELFDPQKDKQMRSEVLRVLGEVRLKQGKYMEGMMDYEAGLRTTEKRSAQQNWLLKLLEKPLKMMGLK